MPVKRALVVDDSKSARVVLSRMLERFGIAVDTAESAEAALAYLKKQHPHVVFMDHLMPGMDGLEAVRILKADPETATIPIMMYTSQEGELYVGQARALGAIGVLPKTVKPIDVTKVLFQLNLLPDRRDAMPSALQPVDELGEVHPPSAAEGARVSRGMIEALLKEQSLELRRFTVASLESQARRLIAELRPAEPEPLIAELRPEPERREQPWGWLAAVLALLLALLVLGGLHWQLLGTAREVEAARAQLAAESADLGATLAQVRATGRATGRVQDVPELQAPLPPEAAGASRQHMLFVPYGEAPLGPQRLDALRELVGGLERSGFRGRVQVTSIPGIFCLAGNAEAGYVLAPPEQPAAECALRGNPYDELQTGAARQPVAFANLMDTLERRSGGGIVLEAVPAPPERVMTGYPPVDLATAGAWNEAAAVNSRLEITVIPQ